MTPPDPRRDLTNAAYQASTFAVALERMNRQPKRECARRTVQVLKVIGAILFALAIFWTLKDAPAKIAATVFQAEQMSPQW